MKRRVVRIMAVLAALMTAFSIFSVSAGEMRYEFPADEGTDIMAPSAMMMYVGVKADQDVVLYEKQADTRYQPGGLMRVAMIGYAMKRIKEKRLNMDEVHGTYTLEMFNHYVAGTGLHVAMMNFGETWTVRDLLTVCTIQTAADCAVVLATAIEGSVETFVTGLNNFARELGCTNSAFTNVTCLNEEGQYMSARDVMMFTRYAMEYPELRGMLELTQYTVTPVSGGKKRSWPTGNDMLRASTPYYYTYATGGKTGGTLTETSLVTFGGKDGYEYMAVVMGAPRKDEKGELTGMAYADARRLIRWGLIGFTYQMIARKNEPVGRINVLDCADYDSISLVPSKEFFTVVGNDVDLTKLTRRIVCESDTLTAPVKAGDKVGTLEIYLENNLIGTVPLAAGQSADYHMLYALWRRVSAAVFSWWTLGILAILVLAAAGYAVLNVQYNKKRKRKSRKTTQQAKR